MSEEVDRSAVVAIKSGLALVFVVWSDGSGGTAGGSAGPAERSQALVLTLA